VCFAAGEEVVTKGDKNRATGTFSANEQGGRTGSWSQHCRAN
jgi:hypothetical protein